MLQKRRRGSKGEPSPGVPPLRAAPAARSLREGIGQSETVPPPPGRGMTAYPVSPQPPRRGLASSTTLSFVHRRLRGVARAAGGLGRPQRGDPRRGSPLYPLLRFFGDGVFRALRRAAKGSAPGPRPLFCKKAGQKTFAWLDFCQPKPLAAAASDTIRPRSGHLSGRVAAPTRVGEAGGSRNLTGAPPPQRRFSLGLHPVSLGKTKEMGWNSSTNLKSSRPKRRVPPTPVKPTSPLARRQTAKRKNRRKSPRSNDRGLSLSGFISRSGTRLSRPRPACRRPWRG